MNPSAPVKREVTLYLSDTAHSELKKQAHKAKLSMSAYIERKWSEWITLNLKIKDTGLIEVMEARVAEVKRRNSDSAIERGDRPKARYSTPTVHDGVIWQAMFGAWGRKAHQFTLTDDAINALAGWTVDQGVVRRRAATTTTLAAQALELIGRGWTKK